VCLSVLICVRYFPNWFLKEFEKLSASQSALKRHKRGKSPQTERDNLWFDRRFVSYLVLKQDDSGKLVMLAVEVGNYTVGFLLLNEFLLHD